MVEADASDFIIWVIVTLRYLCFQLMMFWRECMLAARIKKLQLARSYVHYAFVCALRQRPCSLQACQTFLSWIQTCHYLYIICGYYNKKKTDIKFSFCKNYIMKRVKFSVSSVKYMQKYKGTLMVEKGNQQWFKDLPLIKSQLRQYPLFLYQREPIDIAYEMIKQRVKIITYINKHKYQTIVAKPIQQTKNNEEVNEINEQISIYVKLLNFLNEHKFYVRKSFLDIHPRKAYSSMCFHLGIKRDLQHIKIYNNCHFSKHQIPQNTIFLPFIQQLRYQYRDTSQLKLRDLHRIRNPTQQQINNAIEHWKSKFMLTQIYKSTIEDQNIKKIFAFQNKLGKSVTVEQLMEGQGANSYYAQWENPSLRTETKTK